MQRVLNPETLELLRKLADDPGQSVECVFGGEPAWVVRQMAMGCVALPGTILQPLCLQHDRDRTPLGDENDVTTDILVVDLSLDGGYSKQIGESPLYIIRRTAGVLVLAGFDESE